MLKNHMSTCKKTHVNMQHLFLMQGRGQGRGAGPGRRRGGERGRRRSPPVTKHRRSIHPSAQDNIHLSRSPALWCVGGLSRQTARCFGCVQGKSHDCLCRAIAAPVFGARHVSGRDSDADRASLRSAAGEEAKRTLCAPGGWKRRQRRGVPQRVQG